MFRKSCGVCHFTNTHRPSDITIADYWGWEKTDPEINKDDKGVSLVFCNTEKGAWLFEQVKDKLIVKKAELNNTLQKNLNNPTPVNPNRDEFEKIYSEQGFEAAYQFVQELVKKPGLVIRVKNRFLKVMRGLLKQK